MKASYRNYSSSCWFHWPYMLCMQLRSSAVSSCSILTDAVEFPVCGVSMRQARRATWFLQHISLFPIWHILWSWSLDTELKKSVLGMFDEGLVHPSLQHVQEVWQLQTPFDNCASYNSSNAFSLFLAHNSYLLIVYKWTNCLWYTSELTAYSIQVTNCL